MTYSPHLVVGPCADHAPDRSEKSVRTDALLCEMFDMTPDKRVALLAALRRATEKRDFLEASLGAVCATHHQATRARATADLLGCSERRAQDIVKGETNHFDSWPLVAAAWLDVFTLRGAVLGVQHATGLCAEDVQALIRRHLGPERTAP